jgi:hypothetical protein
MKVGKDSRTPRIQALFRGLGIVGDVSHHFRDTYAFCGRADDFLAMLDKVDGARAARQEGHRAKSAVSAGEQSKAWWYFTVPRSTLR